MELELDNDCLFHFLVNTRKLHLDKDGLVSVEFRRKPSHSPNSDGYAVSCEEGLNITTPVSTLPAQSVPDKEAGSSFSATNIAVHNTIDPFTRAATSELKDVLYLTFSVPKTVDMEVFAVDARRFEDFVADSETVRVPCL